MPSPNRSRPQPTGLSPVRLDPASETPLYRQIYDALRRDILQGLLPAGQRLAATRTLASDLAVSRNTVLEAIEQLVAEGYLTSRVGAGTFVADDLPESLLQLGRGEARPTSGDVPPISRRGRRFRRWAAPAAVDRSRPFQLGRPAVDVFPWRIWHQLLAQRSRDLPRQWLDYTDPAGYRPLREALARHLHASRGLTCSAEQIIIVRGSQQGLDLAGRVLLDPGDAVWIEDPGYPAACLALGAGGARDVPVPLDEEGLRVDIGLQRAPEARLAYVTPSHQYPLGITMSLARRLELLQWARQHDAWILEDDYDSEYRFSGRPLASLAGLDGVRHVIYLGTLSKVLFPALRLGYMVVPMEHVDAFVGARYAADRHTWILEQAVVADFIDQGHFNRHLRRMRRLYAERQDELAQAVQRHLGMLIDLQKSETGLHDVGWLKGMPENDVVAKATEVGIQITGLSSYCRRQHLPPGLLFGYAGFPADELARAVQRLAEVLTPTEVGE